MTDELTETQKAIAAFGELWASGGHVLSRFNMITVDVPGEELVVDVPLDPSVTGPRGALQGGLTATLADFVGGRVAQQGLPADSIVMTTDLTVHYLKGITNGPARAIGKTLRSSPKSRVVRVDVYDGIDGPLAAACTLGFRVVKGG